MPDPYDWESDDEARQREALRHSMFNPDLPGYSLYEGRWTMWAVFGVLLAVAAMVTVAFVVVRPESLGPVFRVDSDGAGCYRLTQVQEGPTGPTSEPLFGVLDACYRDALDTALFVAPIDAPTYRSSAAFYVSAPYEFDSLMTDEPFLLDDLGGGLFMVRTGADDLPPVHLRGTRGPWTCSLDDATPCTSP